MKSFSGLANYAYFRSRGLYFPTAIEKRKIQSWAAHILGSWQMNGFLNWDTGYGRYRFGSAQYWAWSLKALIPLIVCEDCAWGSDSRGASRIRGYARFILDRALDQFSVFDDFNDRPGDQAVSASPYGIKLLSVREKPYSHRKLSANALFLANIALAVEVYGVCHMKAVNPSALWRYDWFVKRLAVSTESYSTSVVCRSFGAFPYAGGELTTLQDSKGRPLTNLKPGSRKSSFNFEYVGSDSSGRILRGQTFNAGVQLEPAPLDSQPLFVIEESPEGSFAELPPYSTRPLQPTFNLLRASVSYRLDAADVAIAYTFLRSAILVDERFDFDSALRVQKIAKTIPMSCGMTEAYVCDVDGGVTMLADGSNKLNVFPDLNRVRYVHYRNMSKGMGLIVMPLRGSSGWGRSEIRPGGRSEDPWNPGGVRGIEYVLMSGGESARRAGFSFLLAPTDGSDESAENRFRFYSNPVMFRTGSDRMSVKGSRPYEVVVDLESQGGSFWLDNGYAGEYTVTLVNLPADSRVEAMLLDSREIAAGASRGAESWKTVSDYDQHGEDGLVFSISSTEEKTGVAVKVKVGG